MSWVQKSMDSWSQGRNRLKPGNDEKADKDDGEEEAKEEDAEVTASGAVATTIAVASALIST